MKKYLALPLALWLSACATPPPAEEAAPVPESPGVMAAPDMPKVSRPPSPVAPAPVPPASVTPPGSGAPATSILPTYKLYVARNDENLLEVFPGMARTELLRVMQSSDARWHNPYRHEALLDRAGAAYEVLYYLTRDPEGKPVQPRHLTPVIVKDGVVVAIGSYRLKKLKRGEPINLPRRAPKAAG